MTDPTQILVAGDWHGNTNWAVSVIRGLPTLLSNESPRLILHCGDFGIWPGQAGHKYLQAVDRALEQAGAVLWFVDGNHEWFPALEQAAQVTGKGWIRDRIWHLPRGHRWSWHGRTWLALGGGVSLDKAARTPGKTWWPQEEITHEQAAEIVAVGHADVMLTHDCPSAAHHEFPPPPPWWAPDDLNRNQQHRRLLQLVVDQVQPAHLIHGHLHRPYTRTVDMGWGNVDVTGLDCDGAPRGNWALLDLVSMEWGDRHA